MISLSQDPSLLAISDIHVGLLEERNMKFTLEEKLNAFRRMVRDAVDHRIGTFLINGDVADARADSTDVRNQAAPLKEALQEYSGHVVFVPGNHDAHFTPKQIEAFFGDMDWQEHVYFDQASGVAATHGHLVNSRLNALISRFAKCVREARADAMRTLIAKDAALRQRVALWERAYAMLESIESKSDVFRDASERIFFMLSRYHNAFFDAIRGYPTLHSCAYPLDSSSVHTVGQLGHALDASFSVYGHDHVPAIYRKNVWNPKSNEWQTAVIGNSGTFIKPRQAPTCIRIESDTMTLLEYDVDGDALTPIDSETLESKVSKAA